MLALDLDYFYAQCEEVRDASFRLKPVVVCVYSGRTRTSGAVSTTNYVARALGVRSGMPIANATRILKDREDAVFLPLDDGYYETVSERIMEIVKSYSKKFEQVSVDEAFLDITEESSQSFITAEQFGRKLKQEILAKERLTCTVGISANKLLAKMAADSSKPDGLRVVPPTDARRFLDAMPVDRLIGIGPKTSRKLHDLGVSTIRDLAQFDKLKLAAVFGKNLGPRLTMMAQGRDDDPVEERPVRQFSRIITLKQDAERFDFRPVLKPLAESISEKLRAADLGSRNIGVIVITAELKTKSRARALGSPISDASEIENVSSSLFQEFFKQANRSRARRVGIRVSAFEKIQDREKEKRGPPSEPGTKTLTEFLPVSERAQS